jgi:hypothetical protein
VKIANVHERIFDATPERLAALIANLDAIWPTQIAPAPHPEGERASLMRSQEFDRPGAVRAFRVVSPPEIRAEHWIEVERVEGGTLLRHTIDGEASGAYEVIWRDRIEPTHDLVLEALLDNVERIIAAEHPGASGSEKGLPATS